MINRLKSTILGLFVGFFALTLILGIFLLPYGPYARRSRAFLRGFDSAAVSRIEIQLSSANTFDGDGRISLIRSMTDERATLAEGEGEGGGGTQWSYLLAGELLPVRSGRVESLLESFPALQRYRTVTTNADLYSELGVGGESGVGGRVLLYDENDRLLVDILQGSVDQQRGVYARFNQGETVELISTELVFYLEQQPGHWQQTQVFPTGLTVSDIAGITVRADQILLDAEGDGGAITAEYQLQRTTAVGQDGGAMLWQVVGQPEIALDQLQVENLASAILVLQADSFSPQRESEVDFASADARVSFASQAGGGRYVLEIVADQEAGGGGPNAYLFRATGPGVAIRPDGNAYLYNANSFSLRPLIQPFSTLLPPPTEAEFEADSGS